MSQESKSEQLAITITATLKNTLTPAHLDQVKKDLKSLPAEQKALLASELIHFLSQPEEGLTQGQAVVKKTEVVKIPRPSQGVPWSSLNTK